MKGKCRNCAHPYHDGDCPKWDGIGLQKCVCERWEPKPVKIRNRKADPAKRRFAKMRNKPYTDWVRSQPCLIANRDCWHPPVYVAEGFYSDPAHVNLTRATGAPDEGEVVNLCRHHHTEQEGKTAQFNMTYGVDLKVAARLLWEAFEASQGVSL